MKKLYFYLAGISLILFILLALPDALQEGALKGFRTRGGNEIDLEWSRGLPVKAKIKGGYIKEAKIKIPGEVKNVKSGEGEDLKLNPDNRIISLNLPEGKIIELDFEY